MIDSEIFVRVFGAGHQGDLHTGRRPGQARRDTRTSSPVGNLIEEPGPAEVLGQSVGGDPD